MRPTAASGSKPPLAWAAYRWSRWPRRRDLCERRRSHLFHVLPARGRKYCDAPYPRYPSLTVLERSSPQGDSKNAARAGMQTCIGRRCFFPNIRQRFFPMKNALFCRHCAKTEKGIFVCPLAGVLDKISFRCTLRLEGCRSVPLQGMGQSLLRKV